MIQAAKFLSHSALALLKKLARMVGKVKMDWAKMIGIMPAMFTIKGTLLLTGMDIRLPTRRPGNITGT